MNCSIYSSYWLISLSSSLPGLWSVLIFLADVSFSLIFSISVPSRCHPNPCENGGKCIDRYDYLDRQELIEEKTLLTTGRQSNDQADDSFQPQFNMQMFPSSSPNTPGITPVDARDFANSLGVEAVNSILSRPENIVGSSRSEGISPENLGFDRGIHFPDHFMDKKGHIPKGINPTEPVNTKHNRTISSNTTSIDHNLKRSGIFHLPVRYKHMKLKRSPLTTLEIEEQLPAGADPKDMEMYGYVCVCSEHYKGHRCERKSLTIIYLLTSFILASVSQIR